MASKPSRQADELIIHAKEPFIVITEDGKLLGEGEIDLEEEKG